MNNFEKSALISELAQLGIKHTPDKIVRIAKQADGKIVFLEEGKAGKRGSGLVHILKEHRDDFARRGISEDEIPDAVMAAVTSGTLLGYQGTTELPREIYEVTFNGKKQYIAVTIGDNGYIVGANPASLP
ncbi:hypothetical protein A0J48_025395 [Sphaerospermopsis aphanizomenoides BCCUSP55]|uniref:hypothetical protein n=1 Tax=Sphaerospermopsis aphanizomenoides TaxID=459663 RepID=UPI0019030C8A|nr:hypothetical protein [Sphaerospermopsis aphanizomenoides]MBK1990803.1 hypothetical protein [Sphaerospermopsis aphanizomenoides BCCUSP55]